MGVGDPLGDDEAGAVDDRERDERDADAAIPPQRARRAEPRHEQRLVFLEAEQQLRNDERGDQRAAVHGNRAQPASSGTNTFSRKLPYAIPCADGERR